GPQESPKTATRRSVAILAQEIHIDTSVMGSKTDGGQKDKKDKKEKKGKKDKKDKKHKHNKSELVNENEVGRDKADLPAPVAAEAARADDLDFDLFNLDLQAPEQPAEEPAGGASTTLGAGAEGALLEHAAAAPDGQEAALEASADGAGFWDALGLGGEEAPVEEPAEPASKLMPGEEAGVLQIPAEAAEELLRKLERIAAATGASLSARNGLLRITGASSARGHAERLAAAVVDGRVRESEHEDMQVMLAPQTWLDQWRGQEGAVEEEFDVLVVFERTMARALTLTRAKKGLLVEAKWSNGCWYTATVAGPGTKAARAEDSTLFINWSADAAQDEVPLQNVRQTLRVAVFGAHAARLRAMVRMAKLAEEHSKGVMSTLVDTVGTSGGEGLEAVRLHANEWVMTRMAERRIIPAVISATSCSAAEVYSMPRKAFFKGRPVTESDNYVLIVGSSSERRLAGQLIDIIANGLAKKVVSEIPPSIAGDCRKVKIPQDIVGQVIGKFGASLSHLMESTKTVIILLESKSDQEKEKVSMNDMEDLLEAMFDQVREGRTTELAIFGAPRQRLVAEARLAAIIESKFPGYHPEPQWDWELGMAVESGGEDGLATDRVWLHGDLEDRAESRENADILAAASGSSVDSYRRMVSLVGTGEERRRAQEYARWMDGHQRGKHPHVLDLERRMDLASVSVPQEAVRDRGLKAALKDFARESRVVAFFDASQEGDRRRLVLAGAEIAGRGRLVTQLLKAAEELVAGRQPVGLEVTAAPAEAEGPRQEAQDSSEGPGQGKGKGKGKLKGKLQGKRGKGKSGPEVDEELPSNVPPPATPAGPGVGVRPPMTPAAPGRGVPPPATPAAPGVAPPATPGGFGPHGNAMPSTPGVIGGGVVAPPATPGGFGPHGNAMPMTPGVVGGGVVAPPATPGGFGSNGGAMPMTPAIVGGGVVAPPATPGGFGGGVPPPSTPAFGRGVPPPATPAAPRRGVPPPATPAVGVAPPATPGPDRKRSIPAPETPGLCGTPPPASAQVAQDAEKRRRVLAAPATPAFLGVTAATRQAPATPANLGASVAQQARPAAAPPASARPPPSARVASGPRLLSFSDVAATQAPSDSDVLPPGWEVKRSTSNGKVYYWHKKRRLSQYERPTD
ncbi:unnamed protein product, partial [Prorocentrum cordatum]